MRRADRQVTDPARIHAIVEACDVCRLGLCEGGMPYVVPMNFGYRFGADERLTLYFHCHGEGQRLSMLQANPRVCFEMDCGHRLVGGDTPCSCSMDYASVIGYGTVEIVSNPEEKLDALTLITGRFFDFPSQAMESMQLSGVMVLKVESRDYTAKQRGTQFGPNQQG